jgi:hypothetical protein
MRAAPCRARRSAAEGIGVKALHLCTGHDLGHVPLPAMIGRSDNCFKEEVQTSRILLAERKIASSRAESVAELIGNYLRYSRNLEST